MIKFLASLALVFAFTVSAQAQCATAGNTTTCTSADGTSAPGQNGGDAADLVAPSLTGAAPVGEQRYEAGHGGSALTVNFDGGDGGDVTGPVVLDVTVSDVVAVPPGIPGGGFDFHLYLQGGNGGSGAGTGAGGDGGSTAPISGTVTASGGADVNIGSIGGHGGGNAEGPGGSVSGRPNSGNAGNSGDINVTARGELGQLVVSAGGGGGVGSLGDNTKGQPGDAGDVTVRFEGSARSIQVNSVSGNSENKAVADPGTVLLVVDGVVAGNVRVQSSYKSGGVNQMSAGPVTVRLEGDASVGGKIQSVSGAGRLEFAMQVDTQAEFDTVAATLAANAPAGRVTVNGRSFAWEGFSDLANLITVLQRQAPSAPITVTVAQVAPAAGGGTVPPSGGEGSGQGTVFSSSAGGTARTGLPPRRIHCDARGYYARVAPDGLIWFYRVLVGSTQESLGELDGTRFRALEDGWSAQLARLGETRLVVDLYEDGEKVTRCIVPSAA